MDTVKLLLSEELSEKLRADISSIIQSEIQAFLKRYDKPWLTIAEVAEILSISEKTLQNYRKNGRLNFIRLDRKVYIERAELDQFMARHRESG